MLCKHNLLSLVYKYVLNKNILWKRVLFGDLQLKYIERIMTSKEGDVDNLNIVQ